MDSRAPMMCYRSDIRILFASELRSCRVYEVAGGTGVRDEGAATRNPDKGPLYRAQSTDFTVSIIFVSYITRTMASSIESH
jgi:hypothetical protein